MTKEKGKFIAFEGLDGSGQTTQAAKLVDHLNRKGRAVHLTKEPTNSLIGGLVRGQLTHDWESSPECLQLLFAADRAHHLKKEILPLLEQGVTVVTDRYFFSTIAFGSTEIDDWEWLKLINKPFLYPDLVLLIKASPETCFNRIKQSRFGFELFEETKILRKVWAGYEKILQEFDKIELIDGEKLKEEVFSQVVAVYERYFN